MRFTALPSGPSAVYFSIGGGFIVREGQKLNAADEREPVAFPFSSGAEMLDYGIPIWQLMLENEKAWHSEQEVRDYLARIWQTMQECMQRGAGYGGHPSRRP